MVGSPWDPLLLLDDARREQLRAFEALLREMNRRINLVSRADEDHLFEHHILHCLSLTRRAFPPGAHVVDWGSGGGLPAIPLAIAFPQVRFTAVDAVGKKMHAVRTMARRLGIRNLEAWHGRAEEFPGKADYSVSRATAPLETLWTWHRRAAHPAESISGGLSRSADPEANASGGSPRVRARMSESSGEAADATHPTENISGGSFRAAPDSAAAAVEAAGPTAYWDPGLIALKGGELDDEIGKLTASDPDVEVAILPLRELLPSPFFAEKVIVTVRRRA